MIGMQLVAKLSRPKLWSRVRDRGVKYGRILDLRVAQKLSGLARVHTSDSEKCDPELSRIIAVTHSAELSSFSCSSPYYYGATKQRERISAVAELNIQRHEGDLIEIGAFKGDTTRHLCAVAQRYSRRVIVVDPWQTGTQDCDGGEFEAFLRNVEPYLDLVDIIRASSVDPKVIGEIATRKLAFAFVDGHHSYDACLSDIGMVRHTLGMIAVDDLIVHPEIQWGDVVSLAFRRGATRIGRLAIRDSWIREGYLLR
jgi:methyltransferase family protein